MASYRYGTVAQLIVRINLEETLSAAKQQMIEELLGAISRKIDNFCNVSQNYFVGEPDVREACLAETAILMKRFEGAMASTLGSRDLGALIMRIKQSALSADVKSFLVDGRHVRPLYGGSST